MKKKKDNKDQECRFRNTGCRDVDHSDTSGSCSGNLDGIQCI